MYSMHNNVYIEIYQPLVLSKRGEQLSEVWKIRNSGTGWAIGTMIFSGAIKPSVMHCSTQWTLIYMEHAVHVWSTFHAHHMQKWDRECYCYCHYDTSLTNTGNWFPFENILCWIWEKLLPLKTKKAKGFYLQNGAHNGVTDFCGICIISGSLASLVMYPWASCLMNKSHVTESSNFYISLFLLSGTPFAALFQLSRAIKGDKVHPAQFGNTKKLPSNSAFV